MGSQPHVAQNTYEYVTKTGKRARRRSRIDDISSRPGQARSHTELNRIATRHRDDQKDLTDVGKVEVSIWVKRSGRLGVGPLNWLSFRLPA